MKILAVDDEAPALDELAYLLRVDPRVSKVATASDATEALRALRDNDFDAVFLDIRMPGLDGMELARVLSRFARPPAIVFVTAYDDAAADAYDLGAVDYVRKPIQPTRLADTLRRLAIQVGKAIVLPDPREEDPSIPVELAGTTKMVARSTVRWVEAQGDYARLHTADGSHLVRVPLGFRPHPPLLSGAVAVDRRAAARQLRLCGRARWHGAARVPPAHPRTQGSAGPCGEAGVEMTTRVRVVLGEIARQRAASQELAEQSHLGDVLLRGLMRAQLALALRLALVVVIGLGGLPLLFAFAPPIGTVTVFGVNLPWLLLGVAAYPFLFGVGYAFVRLAEQNERDFTALVKRPER
jgi:DNA-binding LytR/AlgR family response regulator